MARDLSEPFLPPLVETFPFELRALNQWVAWMAVHEEKKEKPRKVPVNAKNGNYASSTSPNTWAAFDHACAFYLSKLGKSHAAWTKDGEIVGIISGVGFVLTENDPFIGIDVDRCLDANGDMPNWVHEIVERVASYSEISPSGRGIRIFVKGALPQSGYKNTSLGLEVYSSKRYLTVTGRTLNGLPIIENQATLDWIYATYGPASRKEQRSKPMARRASYSGSAIDDTALIQKMLDSKGGEKFERLFVGGDLSGHNGDHSAADLALCSILAFWCRKDPLQMDRIFRVSSLFREKWDKIHVRGETYGAATIGKAIEGTFEVYQGKLKHIVERVESDAAETPETSEELEYDILPPPPAVPLEAFPAPIATLLQEASEAFTVPMQIPAAALLSVLSTLVCGTRLISLRNSWKEPGNIWIAIVADSGIGKSPCIAVFFNSIKELEYKDFKRWQAEYADYENEIAFYRKERQKATRGNAVPGKPVQPKRRQAFVDDTTVEALGEVLAENPRGTMWIKDELAGLIADLDKYSSNSNNGGTRSRLLSSYDGHPWKTSRTSNQSRNLYIPHAYVGILGGIQPAMLPKVFETGTNGVDEASGFLQRFMLIRAIREKPSYWTDQSFSQESQRLLASIVESLWSWDIEYDQDGWMQEKIIQVSPQAKAAFITWFNDIAREEFLSENAALLSKIKGQAQRICLLLHSLDAALAGTDGMELVPEGTMHRALLLANWVKEHQLQCWQFFQPVKGIRQADPIQNAIMQVVVAKAVTIEKQGWKISNESLRHSAEAVLGMSGISSVKIGRAASALGLGLCKVGRNDKGRTVTKEQISSFRKAVRSDRIDRNPTD